MEYSQRKLNPKSGNSNFSGEAKNENQNIAATGQQCPHRCRVVCSLCDAMHLFWQSNSPRFHLVFTTVFVYNLSHVMKTFNKRKKRFNGTPRWNKENVSPSSQNVNSSIEKIRANQQSYDDFGKNNIVYDLVDMSVVLKMITDNLLCGQCGHKSLTFDFTNRVGLALDFVLNCLHKDDQGKYCGYHWVYRNSKRCDYQCDGKFVFSTTFMFIMTLF